MAQWSSNAQDRWHLGVMAGYANQHSNTQSNRVGYKSDGRISGYSAGLYATWYQNDANKTGAYVDSWALYNWFDNSVSSDNRSADDYDSRGVTACAIDEEGMSARATQARIPLKREHLAAAKGR